MDKWWLWKIKILKYKNWNKNLPDEINIRLKMAEAIIDAMYKKIKRNVPIPRTERKSIEEKKKKEPQSLLE